MIACCGYFDSDLVAKAHIRSKLLQLVQCKHKHNIDITYVDLKTKATFDGHIYNMEHSVTFVTLIFKVIPSFNKSKAADRTARKFVLIV